MSEKIPEKPPNQLHIENSSPSDGLPDLEKALNQFSNLLKTYKVESAKFEQEISEESLKRTMTEEEASARKKEEWKKTNGANFKIQDPLDGL